MLYATLFALAALILAFYLSSKKRSTNFNTALSSISNFNARYKYSPLFGSKGIAIDESRKKIALTSGKHGFSVDRSEIIQVEVLRNSTSIQSTNRGSQITGAAVGGIVLGPVGLLLGGLSASKSTSEKVSELTLRVVIENLENPIHEIIFFKSKDADLNDPFLVTQANEINTWYARVKSLMRQSD